MIKLPHWAGRHLSFVSRKEHVKFFGRTPVKDHHSLLDASSTKVATCPPMCVLVRNCLSLHMHICLWCMSLQLQSFFFCIHVLAIVLPYVGVCLCECVWQQAGQRVRSRWFMAAEVWLHWCDWRGEQTGASICLLCGWLHRHTQQIETTQPETLGLPPGDLTQIQPHYGFAQEYGSDSCSICTFSVS